MRFPIVLFFVTIGIAQDTEAGRKLFASRCASCHGADGTGGEHAPSIVSVRQRGRRLQTDLRATITKGIPDGGMPAFPLPPSDLDALERGIDPKVAADQRGHGLGVSMEVYTQADLPQKLAAVRALDTEVIQ